MWITKIFWNDGQLADNIKTYSFNRKQAKKHALDIYFKKCPNRILQVYAGASTRV